jgi:hypothetical protein
MKVYSLALVLSMLAAVSAMAEIPSSSSSTNAMPVPAPPTATLSAPALNLETPTPPAFDPAAQAARANELKGFEDSSHPIDPAKEAEIRKMMELTESEKTMDLVADRMIAIYRQRHPELPQAFWDELTNEYKGMHHKLIDRMVAIYDKYYTLDDLKAANAFYQSPAGQHILAAKPKIMQDAMDVDKELSARMAVDLSIKLMDYKQRMWNKQPAPTNAAPVAPAPATKPSPPAPSHAPSAPSLTTDA